MKAGVEAAAGTERVAAADKLQLHRPCPLRKLSPPRRAEHARDQPDRYNDHGAEQEVAPQPVDGVKAEIPDPLKQKPDAVDDIPGVEANSGKHHPDQD